MSRTEMCKGKITPIKIPTTLALWAEGYCKMNGIAELKEYTDDWVEQLRDSFDEKILIVDDQAFEIESIEIDPDEDIKDVTKNEDGSFNYLFKFYNGGTCLSELLEDTVRGTLK